MNIPHNACVLVADGRKMLFFRNEGDGAHPNLQVETKRVDDNPATRDQGTDRPGSASAPGGSGASASMHSAYEQTDFHQIEEDRFAAAAADMLKTRALAHEFEHLIIVAPPRTLGELRKHYHREVEQRVVGEIAKDLTNLPVDRIEAELQAAE